MHQSTLFSLFAAILSVLSITVYIWRDKIFLTRHSRKMLNHPEQGYSLPVLLRIFSESKPWSLIWYAIFERIIEVRRKNLSELITEKPMESAIGEFVGLILKINEWGIPDHLEMLKKEMEITIHACEITAETDKRLLVTIGNLFEFKKQLADLEDYCFPEHYGIKHLISLIDGVICNVLVHTMAEDYSREKKIRLKISCTYDDAGKKWRTIIKSGNTFICDLDHLSIETPLQLKLVHDSNFNDIRASFICMAKARRKETPIPKENKVVHSLVLS